LSSVADSKPKDEEEDRAKIINLFRRIVLENTNRFYEITETVVRKQDKTVDDEDGNENENEEKGYRGRDIKREIESSLKDRLLSTGSGSSLYATLTLPEISDFDLRSNKLTFALVKTAKF